MKLDKRGALMETEIPGAQKIQGKVRDIYDLGDKMLIVVTDRLSAFDVIMDDGVPGKGKVLNSISVFWFRKLAGLCPNHLITDNVAEYPAPFNACPELQGRSMLVRKLKVVPYECIVRGYLTGSGWAEYQKSGTVNGQPLRAGYQNASKLDEVLFTPTTKAAIGDHDMAVTVEHMAQDIGADLAAKLRDLSIALYKAAAAASTGRATSSSPTRPSPPTPPASGTRPPTPSAPTRPAWTSSSCATGWTPSISTTSLPPRPCPTTSSPRRRPSMPSATAA